ncbi:MAG: hypothetical protein WC509_03880 [Candidatus Izemoplasmatales bacterium]
MRRACLFCLSALAALTAIACGKSATTVATTSVPLPFDAGTLLTPIDPPDSFRDILANGDRILHLDESMVVFREDGGTTVIADGETYRFPSVAFVADDQSRWFLGFDSVTRTLYYYEDVNTRYTSLEFVSLSGIDDEDPAFIGYSETLKFRSPSFTVTGNTIRDFRGATLFQNGETIAFPGSIPGDPLRFYTYHRAYDAADRGCTIETYDGFDAEPSAVQPVHDTYTCGDVAARTRTQVAIEILRYSTVKGYALIDAAGTVHTFLFEDYLPAGATVAFDSVNIDASIPGFESPRFKYEDAEDEMHTVFTDMDFSFVADVVGGNRYLFADDRIRVFRDYGIFDPDLVRIATYAAHFEHPMGTYLEAIDDFLLIIETNLVDEEFYAYTTVLNRSTASTAGFDGMVYEIEGDLAVVDTGDDLVVYDKTTWTVLRTISDADYELLQDGFLVYRGASGMTILDVATGVDATFAIVCEFPYAWTVYGYLLEREGAYFVFG